MEIFRFPNKQLRAKAIKKFMEHNGYETAVCFSCGNATRELRAAGVQVLDISPCGDLSANRWFTMGEIRRWFPNSFDATSGHIPVDCMQYVADEFREWLQQVPGSINLPTGSGETLVELKMAFPELRITAVYNLDAATAYSAEAPLNDLVLALADEVVL